MTKGWKYLTHIRHETNARLCRICTKYGLKCDRTIKECSYETKTETTDIKVKNEHLGILEQLWRKNLIKKKHIRWLTWTFMSTYWFLGHLDFHKNKEYQRDTCSNKGTNCMSITPAILYWFVLAKKSHKHHCWLTIGPQLSAHSRQEMVAIVRIVPKASMRFILSHNDSFWRRVVVFDSRKKMKRIEKEIPPSIMFSQKSCDNRIISEFCNQKDHCSFSYPAPCYIIHKCASCCIK